MKKPSIITISPDDDVNQVRVKTDTTPGRFTVQTKRREPLLTHAVRHLGGFGTHYCTNLRMAERLRDAYEAHEVVVAIIEAEEA